MSNIQVDNTKIAQMILFTDTKVVWVLGYKIWSVVCAVCKKTEQLDISSPGPFSPLFTNASQCGWMDGVVVVVCDIQKDDGEKEGRNLT